MNTKPILFNLNADYGLISVQGDQALKFLQGILTCDMEKLNTKATLFGAFCNIQGRIRALFRIFKQANAVYLRLPKSLIPSVLPAIKKLGMFSKVSIEDKSGQFSQWGIISDIEYINNSFQNSVFHILSIDPTLNRHVLISDANFSNPEAHSFQDWKRLDIQQLMPEIWLETTEQFLPHQINLINLGAVSFTKGCYCGQEIIARMEYKSKIEYQLEQMPIPAGKHLIPGSDFNHGKVITATDGECLIWYRK